MTRTPRGATMGGWTSMPSSGTATSSSGARPTPDTAAACRELIWAAMAERGARRDDPATWPPVMEFDRLTGEAFTAAGLAPALTAAYDELIGPGRRPRPVDTGGAVVVRGPAQDERGNAGYHIEGSYTGPDGATGWVDIRSRGRGLLALFLFTDVGPDDAPTRLLCGSHRYVPEFLAPHGEAGTDSDTEFWRPSVLCLGTPTPLARRATCSCATRSSCTPRPGRTGARPRA